MSTWKPGDWTCPTCSDHVFASNNACRKCRTPKPSGINGGKGDWRTHSGKSGDWWCPHCNVNIFGSKDACFKCGTWRPTDSTAIAAPIAVEKPTDWTCPTCQGWVFGSKVSCFKCGTARPGACAETHAMPPGSKPGDWLCPNCGDLVFASKNRCFKCGAGKATSAATSQACKSMLVGSGEDAPVKVEMRPGDWQCPKCQDVQFAKNAHCRQCGETKPQWLGSAMSLSPPTYWTAQASDGPPWCLQVASPKEIEALRIGMVPGGSFGGKDQKTPGKYSGIVPYAAWRLQHKGLWGKYSMEKENMRVIQANSLAKDGIAIPRIDIRNEYMRMAEELPAQLDKNINEMYLSHGSKPETILAICSGGLNERFSGGLFGNGTYLAEDVAKNDQYCTPDRSHGAHPDLHKLLFDDLGVAHPGDLYYVFVCRAMLGYRIRTLNGSHDLDSTSRSIWSSEKRELTSILGTNPPMLHHSLLVELGGKVARYREFVIYHGDQIYPEYLVAYQRY